MFKLLIILLMFFFSTNLSYAIDKKVTAELIPHCGMTNGGVATATPDGKIYYCPQRIANIDWNYPGAIDFSYYMNMVISYYKVEMNFKLTVGQLMNLL